MRAHHLAVSDQALFIFDHLEGEAKDEVKYNNRTDLDKIFTILTELYGCTQSYVTLQQALFLLGKSRMGRHCKKFSLALMKQVKQRAPESMTNANTLLWDQFVEHVS